jgi:hypothetical protein
LHTDLEYRLKDGEPARVEDYLNRFPELKSDPEAELELITAELRLRRRREPGLALDEFLACFPRYEAELPSTQKGMQQPTATLPLRLSGAQGPAGGPPGIAVGSGSIPPRGAQRGSVGEPAHRRDP